MHIHILGICGTFMGGLAQLARALGHEVSGCDQHVYPPMSDQLTQAGIEIMQGYDPENLRRCNAGQGPDRVVIGNALSRGNPIVEAVLDQGLPYSSGPQWLSEEVLQGRWVLAVAGTHGKTTTASVLLWLLEQAGLQPGFLIGGVPNNFGVSARLGETPFFVIEADEYDTAFFDKRSKFVHYHPRTLILNNLEFDHADIFADVAAIQTQFHHLVRTVPQSGLIVVNGEEARLDEVLKQGCWTPTQTFSLQESHHQADWLATKTHADGSIFDVSKQGQTVGTVQWPMVGDHNVCNALAAIAAAHHVGVKTDIAIDALKTFTGIKRRLEIRGEVNGVTVYDDFAHHPTAIETTVSGLRNKVGREGRIIAVLEPRSNTMRMGVHTDQLLPALSKADSVWFYQPEDLDLGLSKLANARIQVTASLDAIIDDIAQNASTGDHVLMMSNGSFGGIHTKLLAALEAGQGRK